MKADLLLREAVTEATITVHPPEVTIVRLRPAAIGATITSRRRAVTGATTAVRRHEATLRPAAVAIPRQVPDLHPPLLQPEVHRPADSTGGNVTDNRCRTLN